MATTTYPFEFFCEERWTLEEVLEMVKSLHAEAEEMGVPSPLRIAEYMSTDGIFDREIHARAALRDDVMIGGSEQSLGEIIKNVPGKDLEEKIETFTEEVLDGGGETSLESDFGAMLIRDVEVALKLAELPYVPLAHDETDFWSPQA
jgi:hypothetical protein